MNAAIAQHLNVLESAITRIEEWKSVLFVVVKGIGARFVSKKVAKMDLLVEDGHGYGADVTVDGKRYYYRKLSAIPELSIVANTLGRFYDHQHCQIALDAGGVVVRSHQNKWGETEVEAVSVSAEKMIAYCNRLEANRNPHAGMMQTSTGEWVMADDWGDIEGQR